MDELGREGSEDGEDHGNGDDGGDGGGDGSGDGSDGAVEGSATTGALSTEAVGPSPLAARCRAIAREACLELSAVGKATDAECIAAR